MGGISGPRKGVGGASLHPEQFLFLLSLQKKGEQQFLTKTRSGDLRLRWFSSSYSVSSPFIQSLQASYLSTFSVPFWNRKGHAEGSQDYFPCDDKGNINRNVSPTHNDLCPWTPWPSSTEVSRRHQRTDLQFLAFKLVTGEVQVSGRDLRKDTQRVGCSHTRPTGLSELTERKQEPGLGCGGWRGQR